MCNVWLLCPCWCLTWPCTLEPLFRNNFQRCQFSRWKILCLKKLGFGELSSELNSSSGCPGNTGMLETPHLKAVLSKGFAQCWGSSQPLQYFSGHQLQFDSATAGWVRLLLSGINTGSYPDFLSWVFLVPMHICAIWQLYLTLDSSFPKVGVSYLPWQSGRGSSGSSNPSQKKVNSEYTSSHCITVCYQTHRCSPVALWDGASLTLLSSITSFPLIFPAPWPLCYMRLRNCSIHRFR